jgi:hypothetical protein
MIIFAGIADIYYGWKKNCTNTALLCPLGAKTNIYSTQLIL